MAEEVKKPMTDAERLELAAKLDRELDEFINSLEKRQYTEGWPEDRWQEEMDKHPFFMKKPPEPGEELHPLLEGLQQLKYDPEENTTEELATKYKEDGNFYMKTKKFRLAIMCFTEGLKIKSANAELNAALYNNRSAAQFFLKNYRSSLQDAKKALELKPDYAKARWRAAQCALHTEKFDDCIRYCDEILDNEPENEAALELMEKSRSKKLEAERDERKRAAIRKKQQTQFQRLLDALKTRQIKFDDIPNDKDITEERLKPKLLPLEDHPVSLDENNVLTWPAAFSYPEFLFSDFQQQLSEDVTMDDCINSMFAERLPCDKQGKYRPGNLTVYYENRKAAMVHKINLRKTIREILEEKGFYVTGGSLLFYVVPTGSRVEEEFIHEPRRPMAYF
ncbi:unnamed protein product [Hermetia illucens]|uniref:Cns1/TTC4 wheel domain-containing protein n=1 Tax=Hermetia illucens TaxID=343691 RepID=A0A7R8V0K6_HERIL|nr:DNA polymerase interacting tetratricopeptide repeat-containing, protein of 47 kDa [Hermetia illucens]CAD7089394.1 unnamed protein product [Hermetia illucens]